MSASEFWHGEPILAEMYIKAHRLKIEADNQKLWLQGLYFHNAIGVSLHNAFSKKGQKKLTYLAEPLQLFPTKEEERQRKAEKERTKVKQYFDKLIAAQKNRKEGKISAS